jgi:hypothetical protein
MITPHQFIIIARGVDSYLDLIDLQQKGEIGDIGIEFKDVLKLWRVLGAIIPF